MAVEPKLSLVEMVRWLFTLVIIGSVRLRSLSPGDVVHQYYNWLLDNDEDTHKGERKNNNTHLPRQSNHLILRKFPSGEILHTINDSKPMDKDIISLQKCWGNYSEPISSVITLPRGHYNTVNTGHWTQWPRNCVGTSVQNCLVKG